MCVYDVFLAVIDLMYVVNVLPRAACTCALHLVGLCLLWHDAEIVFDYDSKSTAYMQEFL